MADWLTAILLGLVEGLTEFIPVSSTGHLLLLGHFLGFESTGKTFEIVIQLGALLAIISVYFKRLWTLATRWPFDPEARRLSNRSYTGGADAPYKFADAFALLVLSASAVADLNARLQQRNLPQVGVERFRPNIVLSGVDAHEEDFAHSLRIGATELHLVKPCVRCTVPSVDPATGVQGSEPGDTLAVYRDDARAGGVTFGVNGIVVGTGGELRCGDAVEIELAL